MSAANKLLQAASGAAGGDPVYVEDVFSTDTYDGTGSTLSITNGIDNSGEGGMVWVKRRDAGTDHTLYDTARGATKWLSSSLNNAEGTLQGVTAFNNNGYTLGTYASPSGEEWVGWNWRKQAGFFDIVTYTGDGTSSRDIAHSLGSKPGFIITKRRNLAGNWTCYHQALGYEDRLYLDLSNAASGNSVTWVQEPTATHFTVGSENTSGDTYVAYLFAHNDQSFGENSDEAIIKCDNFTTDGSGVATVDLGFEPQWLLIKFNSNDNWRLFDIQRGMSELAWNEIYTNSSNAEIKRTNQTNLNIRPNPTGFKITWSPQANRECVFVAIRRPMKKPDYGTDVFNAVLTNSDSSTTTGFPVNIGFPVDLGLIAYTTLATGATINLRQLGFTTNPQPSTGSLRPYNNTDIANTGEMWGADSMTGFKIYGHNYQRICYGIKRAAGFFDVVPFTFTGATTTFNHNLTVPPEFIITKEYDHDYDWYAWGSVLGANKFININSNAAASSYTFDTAVTATTFKASISSSNQPTVALLFATLAGVSKVGSYSGTGSTINVDCGFSAGARFVLIKRTDDAGNWYYYDSVRGIVAGADPYLLLNSSSVQESSNDDIDPLSSGFSIPSGSNVNTNGANYIFIAIA